MKRTNDKNESSKRGTTDKVTHVFRQPPSQPGNKKCGDCYGLGWALNNGRVSKCSPCDVYDNDTMASAAAAEDVSAMYGRLDPGQELAVGHGYQPFIIQQLEAPTDSCPECEHELTSIEAGYDRYGTVTLEDRVLVIEDAGFSDDGNGPNYLYCGGCEKAYALPEHVERR